MKIFGVALLLGLSALIRANALLDLNKVTSGTSGRSGLVTRKSSLATSMTAVTANANMPKTRSYGSSIAHRISKILRTAAIAFGYLRER